MDSVSQTGGSGGPKTSLAGLSQTNGSSTAGPSSSRKRKASPGHGGGQSSPGHDTHTDDDVSSVGRGSGRIGDHKRTRVHFSCVECHRRKQKCDRKEPCSQCLARKVPHLCRPFLNGVEENSANDVNVRLHSIEQTLSRLVSAISRQQNSHGHGHGHQLPVISNHSSPDGIASLTTSGEDVFHPQSNVDRPPRQHLSSKPPPSGLFPSNMTSSGVSGRSGFGWGIKEGRMINLAEEENPDLKSLLLVLKESGISKGHLEWVIAGVPGRRMADGLVELYFRDIDWTRYKLNRVLFMSRYTAFFDALAKNPVNPLIDAETLKWLPLFFIVIAIATLSAPHELVSRDEQQDWSRRFYGSARSGLEYAKALQRDNLDVLFAGVLAARYMLLTRRPAEGSTPLTTAFQLGLYRDGTVLNLTDKREIEIRRRAWAQLYHLDRTISLLVGRPPAISDAHSDTRAPANLNDEDLEGDFDPVGKPLTQPTLYTYVIVRHKLAQIMGRIAYHTFAVSLPDYNTVLSLDRELLTWRDSLPIFFSMTNPDTSLDANHPYLFVQRFLLASEWYYTRITLNRPYLLRRKAQDARYAYSKDAAIESATADLLNRRAFVMSKGHLVINSGGYRVLNSYMVLGVTIKLDPQSAQADELRQLLNVVSGRAPDAQGLTSEPLVKEELAIVEFLTAKGNNSHSAPEVASNKKSNSSEDQTPVDLLLGLAKTRSGKRAAEEEKRQLRLQQRMEQQEQQRQALLRPSTNGMASPWGYVAPSMPGLDVQQPFGSNTQRRGPRPLQPPPSKKDPSSLATEWSPDLFSALSNSMSGPNFTMINNQQIDLSPGISNQPNYTSYLDMNMAPSDQSSAGTTNQGFLFGQETLQQQFGSANTDSFDFSNLGLDAVQNSKGPQLESFNPFALAQNQTQEEEKSVSDGMVEDEQTQFLNYLLTKFANSQSDAQ